MSVSILGFWNWFPFRLPVHTTLKTGFVKTGSRGDFDSAELNLQHRSNFAQPAYAHKWSTSDRIAGHTNSGGYNSCVTAYTISVAISMLVCFWCGCNSFRANLRSKFVASSVDAKVILSKPVQDQTWCGHGHGGHGLVY